ncbi:MAG: hypothetical protein ACFFKA_00620 [Candidatus Thorarchaeota archaeon]
MAGGKIKAARQRQTGKYSKYASSHRRERNKGMRIVKNILTSSNPAVTAGKVIKRYLDYAKHGTPGAVITVIKDLLSKRNITPITPKEEKAS